MLKARRWHCLFLKWPARASELYFQPSTIPLSYYIQLHRNLHTHTTPRVLSQMLRVHLQKRFKLSMLDIKYFILCSSGMLAELNTSGRKNNSIERNFSAGNKEAFKRFKIAHRIPHCILPLLPGCSSIEKGSQWWIRTLICTTPMWEMYFLSNPFRHCCASFKQPPGINNPISQQVVYSKYP